MFFVGSQIIISTAQSVYDHAFKNGPSEICGRQPLKNLK